ncbi:MAG: ABC transporter permease [Pseudonocardia sp.]|nr:ABC transporter permease [Pseudonocardia sp.]
MSRVLARPARGLEMMGDQLSFYVRAYGSTGRTVVRYRREILNQIAAVTFGTGALAVVGGTAMVLVALNLTTGAEVGVQGFTNLNKLGLSSLVGFFSAYVNTRIAAPLIATVGFVATVGAGMTAELGARRISEEIDALEVMAVPSVPYLVTTRILAGLVAITPLYAIALFVSFGITRVVTVLFYGESGGAYDHYFSVFLIPTDIMSSYIQVLAMSVVIVSVHCYYGYHARGGPAGVGEAVGRSVRLSLILVLFTQFALTMLLYGSGSTLHVAR